MSETKNYGLYLTDSAKERFRDWREKMCGKEGSNMQKIDAALGGKADKSSGMTAVLLASGWTGVEAPFFQELLVEGLSAEQNGVIGVAHSATPEQREMAREALLSVSGQADGKLTVVADGELPELDIPVQVVLIG